MNKDIFKYLFILVLAVIVSVLIYFHFEDNRTITESKNLISSREEYKEIKVSEIYEIELRRYSLVESSPNVITDEDKIKEVFKILGDIEIGKESNLSVTDDGFSIYVKTKDNTLSYYFEGTNISLDNKQYTTKGLYLLKEKFE